MPPTRKLVDLTIEETSGVDHPAHLHEGWLVRKDAVATLEQALTDAEDTDTDTDQGIEMELEATTTIENPADAVVEETEPVEEPAPVAKDDSDDQLVAKELADLRKSLDEARAESAALRDERDMEKATARISEWNTLPGVDAEFAPVLRALRAAAPDEAAVIEGILDGCAAALAEAGVLKQIGIDADDQATDAWDQIEALAKSAVDAGRARNVPEGIGLVAAENPDLYTRYRREQEA